MVNELGQSPSVLISEETPSTKPLQLSLAVRVAAAGISSAHSTLTSAGA